MIATRNVSDFDACGITKVDPYPFLEITLGFRLYNLNQSPPLFYKTWCINTFLTIVCKPPYLDWG